MLMRQDGFSMIDLLVASSLMIFLMVAVFYTLTSNRTFVNRSVNKADMILVAESILDDISMRFQLRQNFTHLSPDNWQTFLQNNGINIDEVEVDITDLILLSDIKVKDHDTLNKRLEIYDTVNIPMSGVSFLISRTQIVCTVQEFYTEGFAKYISYGDSCDLQSVTIIDKVLLFPLYQVLLSITSPEGVYISRKRTFYSYLN